MIRHEIGEILIQRKKRGLFSEKTASYKLTPSFENISKIGDSDEIIKIYSAIINDRHVQLLNLLKKGFDKIVVEEIKKAIREQLKYAKRVISSCCDKDISGLKLKIDTEINIAALLLKHGVQGYANVRVSQRNESREYQSKFDVTQYINNARIHLGLSFDEAKKLTMTEYILLMSAKFPDNQSMTSKEYQDVMSDYKRRKQERLKNSGD